MPALVLSHANGFPAGTYRVLLEAWRAAGFTVHALEKFGHDARYPVSGNWPHLRDQLIAFIEAQAGEPAWLVGHSLGGYLSLMAAARRPDLARGVVLLDSPVVSGVLAAAVRFGKLTGIGKRFSPGRVSQRRRQHWPDAESAFRHFAAKPVFARWDPQVLRDYIASGTEPGPDGHTLSFRREVETEIYDTLPHHLGRLLRVRPLSGPAAFIGGTQSLEVRRVGLRATRWLTQGRLSWIDGSHL
jgi:pimeloyl-ACP methyl ester carboxylesterase